MSSWVIWCFPLVWNFLCYSLSLLPVALLWTPLRRIWLCFAHSHHLLSHVITCVRLHFIPYQDTKSLLLFLLQQTPIKGAISEAFLSTLCEGTLPGTDGFYHPASGRLSQWGFYLMHMLEYPCGLVCVGTVSCQFKQRAAEMQRSFS